MNRILLAAAALLAATAAQADTYHYACKSDGDERYALTVNINQDGGVVSLLESAAPHALTTFRILKEAPVDVCAKSGWILSGGATFCTATQGVGNLDRQGHGPDLDCDSADAAPDDPDLTARLTQGWNPTPAGTPTKAPPTKASPYDTYSGYLVSDHGRLHLNFKEGGEFVEGDIRLPASERRRILQACKVNQPCTVIGISKPNCGGDCSNVVKIISVFAGSVKQ